MAMSSFERVATGSVDPEVALDPGWA